MNEWWPFKGMTKGRGKGGLIMSGQNVYRTDIWVLIMAGHLFREGLHAPVHPLFGVCVRSCYYYKGERTK